VAETTLSVIIKAKDDASKVLRSLSASVNKAKKDIEALNRTAKTGNLSKETDKAANSAKKLGTETKKAATNVKQVVDRTRPLANNLNKATQSAETLAASISNSRGQLLATAAVAAGLFLAIKRSTDAFFELELAVAEIATLVDTAKISNEALTDSVVRLSNEFGTNAVEVAKATYQAISAGAEAGAEANQLLEVALRTAIGGVTDVDTAVDGLTTVINAFGFGIGEAERVSDILFATMKNGKTTIGELSERFFQLAPVASAMGVSLEESSAALIALTLQGVPTRVAMTQIRAALTGFARDNPFVLKAFRDIGFESFQAAIAAQGLGKTFADLNELTGGSTGELQKLTGSIEGVQAILGTTGDQAKFFASGLKEVENSSGATQEAFEKVQETLGREFQITLNEIINTFREFGEAAGPTLVALIKVIGTLAKQFGTVLDALGPFAPALVGAVTILTLLTAAFTALVVAAGFTLIAFRELAPVLTVLRSGFTGATSAIKSNVLALNAEAKAAAIAQERVLALGSALRTAFIAFAVVEAILLIGNAVAESITKFQEFEDIVSRVEFVLRRFVDFSTGEFKAGVASLASDINAQSAEVLGGTIKQLEAEVKAAEKDLKDLISNKNVSLDLDFKIEEGAVNSLRAQVFKFLSGLGPEGPTISGFIGLDTGEGLPVELKKQLELAAGGADFLRISLANAKKRLDELNDTKALQRLDDLKRPFEEMENAIKATIKLFQDLDNIKLKNAEAEVNRLADQQIAEARVSGDPFAETNIREATFEKLADLREKHNADELSRNQILIQQLALNIGAADQKTVEQERKVQDRINKLVATNIKIRVKQAKDEASFLIKEIKRVTLEQQTNAQARKVLADQAVKDAQTIKDALAAIDDARAVERGRDETVVQRRRLQAQLTELQELQRKIVENEGQVEQSVRDRVKQLSDTLIQGGQALGTSGGFLDAVRGKNFIKAVGESQEAISKVTKANLDKQDKDIKKSLEDRTKEFKKLQTEIDKLKLDAKVTLGLDDEGLTSFQQEVLNGVVKAEENLNISPSINLDKFEEDISALSGIIEQSAPDLSGFLTAETESGGFIQRLFGADGNILSNAVAGFNDVDTAVASMGDNLSKVVEAITNLNNDDFFSDTKTRLQSAFTSEEIGTAFADGLSTGVDKTVKDLIDGIRKGLADLNTLAGFDVSQPSAPGFSGGGHVNGPGTSTSDSITARLSNNEFVMQARAVQKYGVGLFHQLNSLSFNSLPKFASGGLVQTRIPAPSTSSEIQRDVVDLNFNIGGQKIQLQGRRDMVAALTRATRQLQSTLIGG
jgi:TP901 family phage tail tape measure protein